MLAVRQRGGRLPARLQMTAESRHPADQRARPPTRSACATVPKTMLLTGRVRSASSGHAAAAHRRQDSRRVGVDSSKPTSRDSTCAHRARRQRQRAAAGRGRPAGASSPAVPPGEGDAVRRGTNGQPTAPGAASDSSVAGCPLRVAGEARDEPSSAREQSECALRRRMLDSFARADSWLRYFVRRHDGDGARRHAPGTAARRPRYATSPPPAVLASAGGAGRRPCVNRHMRFHTLSIRVPYRIFASISGRYVESGRPRPMTLDPITLGVIQAGLQQVCDEMDLAFSRAAFSPVIAEADDRSDGIYAAADGALIAQGSRGLPVFVGTMQFSTRHHHRAHRRRPDPAARARRHLHRQRPLPRRHPPDGRPLRHALLARRNASSAGSPTPATGPTPAAWSPAASPPPPSPPSRRACACPRSSSSSGARMDPEIYAIITSNIRVAEQRIGDVKAQASALLVGAERLTALLDRYGDATVDRRHRRDPRPRRRPDARDDRADPRRHLPVPRLRRQRRRRQRAPDHRAGRHRRPATRSSSTSPAPRRPAPAR